MPLAISLPIEAPLPDNVAVAQECADWGYRAAWASEVAGPDFASLLGAVAAVTDLDLGVAVAPMQTRSAWLLGATAASLAHLSHGRFSLGVGTSSEVIVERWSGLAFERPLAELRETVEALRAVLSGERVRHAGEFHSVDGYRLFAPTPGPVPILVGALNPASLRQAGEIGDGVCLNQLGPEHLPMVLDEVADGARKAGRDPGELEVVARLMCWVTDDVAAARDKVRWAFAPYAATSVYNRFFRWLGFEKEMDGVAAAMAERDRQSAAAALTDRFVDTIYVLGGPDEVADRVQAYCDGGVTVPVIACLGSGADEARRTLRAVGERLG